MIRFSGFVVMSLCMALGAGAAVIDTRVDPGYAVPSPIHRKMNAPKLGIQLTDAESLAILGGDVRITLNEARTEITVRVTDTEYEARLGRLPPLETYKIPVSNTVVNTTRAPFYPAEEFDYGNYPRSSYTTKPVVFPAGAWDVTDVSPRSGSYGPYMIKTNAVGTVDVYRDGRWICKTNDIGYALHGTTKPVEVAKSYGCIVMTRDDVERLGNTLLADRAKYEDTRQVVVVSRPEPVRSRD